LSAGEGIRGVTVGAAQRTSGQAHEHGRQSGAAGLALQGKKDFADAQRFGSGLIHGLQNGLFEGCQPLLGFAGGIAAGEAGDQLLECFFCIGFLLQQ